MPSLISLVISIIAFVLVFASTSFYWFVSLDEDKFRKFVPVQDHTAFPVVMCVLQLKLTFSPLISSAISILGYSSTMCSLHTEFELLNPTVHLLTRRRNAFVVPHLKVPRRVAMSTLWIMRVYLIAELLITATASLNHTPKKWWEHAQLVLLVTAIVKYVILGTVHGIFHIRSPKRHSSESPIKFFQFSAIVGVLLAFGLFTYRLDLSIWMLLLVVHLRLSVTVAITLLRKTLEKYDEDLDNPENKEVSLLPSLQRITTTRSNSPV